MENTNIGYVYFDKTTRKPTKFVTSDNFEIIVLNAGENEVYVPLQDKVGWEDLRLVDINTLEVTREEQQNG